MDKNITRIAIIEDDDRIRDMLVVLLEGTHGMRCVAAYQDAQSALNDIGIKMPDYVLVDINLPGMNGIEAVAYIRKNYEQINCIMLTVYEDSHSIFEALKAGAIGYLLKSTSPTEIIEAIREAIDNGSPMSAPIARKVVQSFSKPAKSDKPVSGLEDLTEREHEILNNLAKGYTYHEIGEELFISKDTVHSHIRSIYKKMQVRSRTEAVVKYLGR